MNTAIILCTLCVSVFVIWSSLQSNLVYIVISDTVLDKWRIECPNLIIIKVLPKAAERSLSGVADSLEVPPHELASLLCWIPHGSTVVICHQLHIYRFDDRIEAALLRAAIDTVYLLDIREYARLKDQSARDLHPPRLAPGQVHDN
jgi:hypothetical protein